MGISDGLVAGYLLKDTSIVATDFTGNGNSIALTNTSWVDGGLKSDSIGEHGVLDNTDSKVVNTAVGTIILKFTSLSAFNDATSRVLFGVLTSGKGRFVLEKGADGRLWIMMWDNLNNHYINFLSAKIPNWQTGTQISFLWRNDSAIWNSDNMVCNIDGAHVTPSAANRETGWNVFSTLSNLGFLGNATGTSFANGTMEYAYYFNQLKTEEELATEYNYPGSIFYDFAGAINSSVGIGCGCGL